MFDHVNDERTLDENDDEQSMKLETIREMTRARLQPVHVMHRYGMRGDVAIDVEATLVDMFAGA